jgi:hypothetical protein
MRKTREEAGPRRLMELKLDRWNATALHCPLLADNSPVTNDWQFVTNAAGTLSRDARIMCRHGQKNIPRSERVSAQALAVCCGTERTYQDFGFTTARILSRTNGGHSPP